MLPGSERELEFHACRTSDSNLNPSFCASRRGLEAVLGGFLRSDADVVWFGSPWPVVGGRSDVPVRADSVHLAEADILASTDCIDFLEDLSPGLVGHEQNTGMLFLRSTLAAIELTKEWQVAKPTLPANRARELGFLLIVKATRLVRVGPSERALLKPPKKNPKPKRAAAEAFGCFRESAAYTPGHAVARRTGLFRTFCVVPENPSHLAQPAAAPTTQLPVARGQTLCMFERLQKERARSGQARASGRLFSRGLQLAGRTIPRASTPRRRQMQWFFLSETIHIWWWSRLCSVVEWSQIACSGQHVDPSLEQTSTPKWIGTQELLFRQHRVELTQGRGRHCGCTRCGYTVRPILSGASRKARVAICFPYLFLLFSFSDPFSFSWARQLGLVRINVSQRFHCFHSTTIFLNIAY